MGYAIIGGIGLALGLGLMIWALRERARRHQAEQKALEAEIEADAQRELAESNAAAATDCEADKAKIEGQVDYLREALEEARDRLKQCDDPATIRDWLADELKGGPV